MTEAVITPSLRPLLLFLLLSKDLSFAACDQQLERGPPRDAGGPKWGGRREWGAGDGSTRDREEKGSPWQKARNAFAI